MPSCTCRGNSLPPAGGEEPQGWRKAQWSEWPAIMRMVCSLGHHFLHNFSPRSRPTWDTIKEEKDLTFWATCSFPAVRSRTECSPLTGHQEPHRGLGGGEPWAWPSSKALAQAAGLPFSVCAPSALCLLRSEAFPVLGEGHYYGWKCGHVSQNFQFYFHLK